MDNDTRTAIVDMFLGMTFGAKTDELGTSAAAYAYADDYDALGKEAEAAGLDGIAVACRAIAPQIRASGAAYEKIEAGISKGSTPQGEKT